jgi:hypothetical protein
MVALRLLAEKRCFQSLPNTATFCRSLVEKEIGNFVDQWCGSFGNSPIGSRLALTNLKKAVF